RATPTATLLPSGQVLVAGGNTSTAEATFFASAELYDPVTNHWHTTGAMSAKRSLHSATLMRSGQVLVVDGADFTGGLASAEIYDPATGTWLPADAPSTVHSGHTATLL